MKRIAWLGISLTLIFGPFLLGCDQQPAQAMAPVQPTPQISQQEMLKGVIQDYLNQTSPGNQIQGANFLPLTNNLYVAQASLQGGTLNFKKDMGYVAREALNLPKTL